MLMWLGGAWQRVAGVVTPASGLLGRVNGGADGPEHGPGMAGHLAGQGNAQAEKW